MTLTEIINDYEVSPDAVAEALAAGDLDGLDRDDVERWLNQQHLRARLGENFDRN